MKYEDHALLSAYRYGGNQEDYLEPHYLMDFSKHFVTNGHAMHRAVSHNWWGITLIEQALDKKLINKVSIRQLLIDHVREDCGIIPSLEECLRSLMEGTYMRDYNRPRKKDLETLARLKGARMEDHIPLVGKQLSLFTF